MKYLMMSALLFAAIPTLHGEVSTIPVPPAPKEQAMEDTAPEKKVTDPVMSIQPVAPDKNAAPAAAQPVAQEAPKVAPDPKSKEIPKTVESAKVEPPQAEAKPFGCVAELTDMISFHQAEILNLKKLIQRWNDKVGATLKRRQDMEKDILDLGKQIDDLDNPDDKRNKKEIARLQKQSGRISKDIKAADKELKAQCKELAGELKEVSKESLAALKEKFQGVIRDIQEVTEN